MAVTDERREGCDGCGGTVPLRELTTVTMPDGEALACCPECEPHAREVAEKLAELNDGADTCDGCQSTFPPADLEEAVLTDGTVVTCCGECIREVPGHSDGSVESSVNESVEVAETTEIATPRNLCSQCHEFSEEELFHVSLIDGRTEEMCRDCRDLAEANGVVNGVKMRQSEAREILGVDEGASGQEIREAFLDQIKNAHPDRKGGTRSAFKLVKEAYDRLS